MGEGLMKEGWKQGGRERRREGREREKYKQLQAMSV